MVPKSKLQERKKGKQPEKDKLPSVKKRSDHIEREPGSKDLKELLPAPTANKALTDALSKSPEKSDKWKVKEISSEFDKFMKENLFFSQEEILLLEQTDFLKTKLRLRDNLRILDPSEKVIQEFIDGGLKKHEREPQFPIKAGLFLSSLVDVCPQKKLSFDISNIFPRIDHLGVYHCDDERVTTFIGDVGADFGSSAEGGVLICQGSSRERTGNKLNGATILIKGSAGPKTANEAREGDIKIFGSNESLGKEISRKVEIKVGPKKVWPKKLGIF